MSIEKRGDTAPEETTASSAPTPPQSSETHKPVLKYLVILFAIAFLLIILSFVMHQRSNAEVLQELQSQVETLQELQEVEEKYSDLLDENAALSQQIDNLTNDITALNAQMSDKDRAQEALNLVWQLERLYTSGKNDACREVIDALKEDELYLLLPSDIDFEEGEAKYESPREAFDRINTALNG